MKKIWERFKKFREKQAIKQGKKFFRIEGELAQRIRKRGFRPANNMVSLIFIADENNIVCYTLASRKTYPENTLKQIAEDEIVKRSSHVDYAANINGRGGGQRNIPAGEISVARLKVLILAAQINVKVDNLMANARAKVMKSVLKSMKRFSVEKKIAPICILLASLLAIPIFIMRQQTTTELILSVIQVLTAGAGSLLYLKYKERLSASIGYFLVAAGVINILYLLL